MGSYKRKKCKHCKTLFIPDPRNAKRQRYCRKPECKKASKTDSQRRWLQKPENQNYFQGPENVERVQQWRKTHPGYWRKKPKTESGTLQDPLNVKPSEINKDNPQFAADSLQDSLIMQPAVLIGLIATFTDTALQDDIAFTVRRLQQLGTDIVNASTPNEGGRYVTQKTHHRRTDQKGTQAV